MNKLEFQKAIVNRFEVSYKTNKLLHAYILSGKIHSGQLEVAKYVAKLLLNMQADQKDILNNPNVFYITTDRQNISKQQALDISHEIASSSIHGQLKVFIVNEAEKLSISAQNSLLKIIEDPVSEVYIFFITENEYQLLPTIVSRSIVVKFKSFPFIYKYEELASNYDDLLRFKYALYLDDVNYDDLYTSEIMSDYMHLTNEYLSNYFTNNDYIYLLDRQLYSKINNRQQANNFIELLLVNASSIVEYLNGVNTVLFDERVKTFISDVTSEEVTKLLSNLFIAKEMIVSNVNHKLVIDKLTISRRF